MSANAPSPSYPDGITAAAERGGANLNWLSLAVLGAVMLAALLGAFGGGKARNLVTDAPAARLEVHTPRVVRNGMFFETRLHVTAKAPIADAVIVVPAALWRDMTINTMIPAPGEEKAGKGAFRFSYGPLAPGEVLEIKIDGQINPPLFAGTRGTIELHDGERPLAAIPVEITVLP
ncbi:hypothetical protein OK349_12610 [Sphingomonas sp. BT-65]|uniref:hypothetical protein n=1 Tax=Sphingomonas sp. BT-65 TaxID=2989821 RepID=UPI0022356BC8|nr:hypothetical protein [Sphingomonas sp. BT-65]MCW4462551.1 hypothetical protein [Sphingomonas sp. BT-65]